MSVDRYMTLDQAVEIVPLSSVTLRRAIKRGDLVAFHVGRRVLIRPEDLHSWVESCRVVAEPPMPKPDRRESREVSLLDRAMKARCRDEHP
jgi:excisionase family DNA binding protein